MLKDYDAIIVKILEENLGKVVSGEELAINLGISRVALWKRIKKLKDSGVPIKSVERKGYMLTEIPDLLIKPLVLSKLKNQVIGKNYIYFDIIDSTNRYAKEEALKGAPHGTVVVADSQTKGRGRLGRSWFSPKGKNLYFSIILRYNIPILIAPQLTFTASVAVCETLRTFGVNALIKWPNDIFASGKKICGILNELVAKEKTCEFLIIGIGVNVNIEKKEFPSELREIATSVYQETGKKVLRRAILVLILENLEKWLKEFEKKNTHLIFRYWREHNYTLGKKIRVDNKLEGTAIGVTPYGELLLKDEHGKLHRISSGDVEIITK